MFAQIQRPEMLTRTQWAYTNDSSYNDVVEQGLISQVGPNWDYQPQNETNGMGNDDQGMIPIASFPHNPPMN